MPVPPTRARTRTRLALATTSALCLPALLPLVAAAQDAPQLRAVTLSTAGLALIEAEGRLGADPLRLTVARDRIDDFLKSLWVIDPAGAVPQVSLGGPGAFADAFALLPFGPGDVTDPVRLFAAMVGAPVVVERRGESWAGANLGVTQRPCEHGPCHVLNLQEADGTLRSFEMGDALTVRLSDAADRAAVAAALAAHRGAANPRRVEVALGSDDATPRDVGLVWLQEAPLWRTAWRAIDTADGLQLVGWAVVENATGQDWHDVRLTLATGAVRSIEAQLYERAWAAREGAVFAFDEAYPAPAFEAAASQRSFALAEASPPPPAAAEADDGQSFSRFTLVTPVSLPAGQMISLPFLSETLPDARLTVYRGGQGALHPAIALRIDNPLPLRLPAGVLTFYEDGRGHAGDALIPELAPGGSETVAFARDTAVEVREEVAAEETIRDMRIVRGVLVVGEDAVRRTAYRIAGAPEADRVLTLEHPRRGGWQIAAPAGAEEDLDVWRWALDVPAGGTLTHEVIERQPRERSVGLVDADLPTLAYWQGRSIDDGVTALLEALAGERRTLAGLAARAGQIAERAATLEAEQLRLVNLIVQLGDDSQANRDRRARVDAIDGELAMLQAEAAGIAEAQEAAAQRIDDLLGL